MKSVTTHSRARLFTTAAESIQQVTCRRNSSATHGSDELVQLMGNRLRPATRSPLPLLVAAVCTMLAIGCGVPLRTEDTSKVTQNVRWEGEWVWFDQLSVEEVVRMFNERNPNAPRIIVRDAWLAQQQLGGRARLRDADTFVKVLTTTFRARSVRGTDSMTHATVIYLFRSP